MRRTFARLPVNGLTSGQTSWALCVCDHNGVRSFSSGHLGAETKDWTGGCRDRRRILRLAPRLAYLDDDTVL